MIDTSRQLEDSVNYNIILMWAIEEAPPLRFGESISSSTDKYADALRSKVVMVRTVDCPPIEQRKVQLLFSRDRVETFRTVSVQRPTYFDQLCTVIVEGVSFPPRRQPQPLRSARDVLRRPYWYALDLDTKYGSPLRFDKPVLDIRFYELNNVSHLLTDAIPACLYARDCIGSEVSFVSRKVSVRFRELLSVFGIEPIVTHKRIVGPIVRLRGTRGLAVYNLEDAFDCNMISFVPNIYSLCNFKTTVKYEKVFLARRGARLLRNHSDVERLLTEHGYTTVYMEDFSILDQISIGMNARHVVAIHGAAMAFFLLNPNVDSLIELSPPHVYAALFPVLLGARVGKYILVIQEFDERIVHNGWDTILQFKSSAFEANIKLLERALAEVENSASEGACPGSHALSATF